MTTQTLEFLQNHAPDGALTPELAAQLLELAEGDTGNTPENGAAPAGTTETDDKATDAANKNDSSAQAPAAEPGTTDDKPVILAKDGKHTIPYEKLEEARRSEQAAKAAAAAALQELEALRAQALQRAEAGQAPTAADNASAIAQQAIDSGEVDPAIFGDFSEGAMAKGIATLIKQGFAAMRQELAPIQEQHQRNAVQDHYSQIYERHPDADSVAQSNELAAWINGQPSFVRDSYWQILDPEKGGTAQQVIELFDSFKRATGATQPAAAQGQTVDPKAAAKAAIASAMQAAPNSLTDIPGGRAGAVSKYEAMDALTPAALAEALESMSEDERNNFLSRRL